MVLVGDLNTEKKIDVVVLFGWWQLILIDQILMDNGFLNDITGLFGSVDRSMYIMLFDGGWMDGWMNEWMNKKINFINPISFIYFLLFYLYVCVFLYSNVVFLKVNHNRLFDYFKICIIRIFFFFFVILIFFF